MGVYTPKPPADRSTSSPTIPKHTRHPSHNPMNMATTETTTESTGTTTISSEETLVRQREQQWVLGDIRDEMASSVKHGLEECLGRLCEKHSGFKLVVSSNKSEAVKGIITRAGSGLEDIDLQARIHSINNNKPFNIKLDPNSELPLTQVVDAANFLSEALQVVTTAFEATSNGQMVRVRTCQVLSFIRSAVQALKEPQGTIIYPLKVTDKNKFTELPPNLAIDIYITDSSLITDIRAVEYLDQGSGSFGGLLSFKRHSNAIPYNGGRVVEHERIRVTSQDPNLISVSAKLTALETHLETIRSKLDICFL